MKNYDYKDETKDVKGKVSPRQKYKIPAFEELITIFPYNTSENANYCVLFVDWET